MRLLAIFFAIFSICEANAKLSFTPRWRESYGGETSIAEFKSIAYDVFKGLSDESYTKVDNLKKAAVLETIKNSVVECKSDLVLDGVTKDAINYPLRTPQLIEFDCKKWDTFSYSKQLSLVVHEYLFLSFIDDTGYDVSSHVAKMYVNDNYDQQKGSLLRTAISTCNVDFYNAIIPQMPVPQVKLVVESTLLKLTMRDGCIIFKDLIERGFTNGYEQILYDELALAIAETIEILKVDPKTASPDNYQSDPAFRKAILADRIAILELFYGKRINFENLVLNQTYPYNIFTPDYSAKYSCKGSNLLHVTFYAYSHVSKDYENQTVFIDLAEALMRAGFQIDTKNECGLSPKDLMRNGAQLIMKESIVLQLIEKEFSKRRLINPSYSLRAYSKSLGVSPSNLSRILAKKKEITPNVVKKIAGSLKFDEELLRNLVDYHSKVKKSKNIKNIDNENIKRLDLETFSVISEWYHYAILEVYNLSSKKKVTPEFIQKKLGLDAKTVTNALKNLASVNLISLSDDDEYFPTDNFTAIEEYNFTSTAMRERQKQILALSIDKMDKIDISKRDHSAITMAVDIELLPEIKDRIKVFRRSLANYIEKNSKKTTDVYEFHVGFIPLTDIDV